MTEDRKDSSANGHAVPNGISTEKAIDLDYVLVNELGQFGRYQLINTLLISIPLIMSAFMSEFIFGAAAIPHRCRIPECGEYSKRNKFSPEWVLDAIPASNTIPSGFENCERFPSVGNGTLDVCPAYLFDQDRTVGCDSFVYARSESVVYEFDLACQEWMRALAGTLNSVGTLLVLPITGYVSDRFGRRVALIISVFNMATFGLIRAFSVNYPMYLVLQIVQTTLGAGTFSSAYIFAAELVGPKYRVVASATSTSMFAVGQVILGATAMGIDNWRYLLMVLNIPIFLVLSYYWLLPESVRWLLSKGKFEEARVVLEKVARVNRKQISEKSMAALMSPPSPPPTTGSVQENDSLLKSIMKSKILLRRVLTTPIWWITTTFVYYGLSINSTSLSDQMHLNYMLTVGIEIPGFYSAVLVLDRIGRKPTLCGGFFLSAACNFAFAFIPSEMTVLRLVIFLLGKFGIALVFTSLYLFTSELYPTQYRHSLLAFSSMIGRVGSITAPLTPVLTQYWHGIPSMMFGSMAMLSGVLVLTQPETLGTKMPQTLTTTRM
ncbi:organic cation transporter protein-like [Ostrinia furnacalis]|uniref:organic cation transporter protein-like n=1 Tax=Ostrinia furnacalis TaxID=93504 RepID=UPI00103EEF15|nr:organic cation transporter protein-like [Ostrinia furnacalis]